MLKDLLESKKCFKLVCGAGNEDIEEIKRLVYVYALAGCKFFDLCANENVINCAKEALQKADINDAYLCVSVGIKNDPHVNKAVIDYNKCVNCGACEEVCPQDAIHYAKVKKYKCIGCGRCWKVCQRGAISYVSEEKILQDILPPILNKNIDCIELHAMGIDDFETEQKWNYLNDNFDGLLSICISRANLSDEKLISRIKHLIKNRKPYTTIVQADGFPMSGGDDTFKSTLQSIATAEIVQNQNLPVYIMLSGGTNTKSTQLAKLCDIEYSGVAVGSYARKIVKKYIDQPEFWTNSSAITDSINIAHELIMSVVK